MEAMGVTTNMTRKTNYWRTTDNKVANKIQALMLIVFKNGCNGPDMLANVLLIPESKLYKV